MAELTLRGIEATLVDRLKERAALHDRSIEEEHKAILCQALLGKDADASGVSFEAYLRTMPDVGADADFSRIEGGAV